MMITVAIAVTDDEAKRVFDEYLNKLIGQRWIENGRVMVEAYTSHRFDHDLGKATEPRFKVLRAAIALREALKKEDE